MTSEITSVMVAELWMDTVLVWTNAYPAATKKQATTYASNSAEAKQLVADGHRPTVRVTRFGATHEVEEVVLGQ